MPKQAASAVWASGWATAEEVVTVGAEEFRAIGKGKLKHDVHSFEECQHLLFYIPHLPLSPPPYRTCSKTTAVVAAPYTLTDGAQTIRSRDVPDTLMFSRVVGDILHLHRIIF